MASYYPAMKSLLLTQINTKRMQYYVKRMGKNSMHSNKIREKENLEKQREPLNWIYYYLASHSDQGSGAIIHSEITRIKYHLLARYYGVQETPTESSFLLRHPPTMCYPIARARL